MLKGLDHRNEAVKCKGFVVRLLLPLVIGAAVVPAQGYADEISLLNLSFRTRISGATVLGDQQPEEFNAYDFSANLRLPWTRELDSDWELGTRLMTSAGILRGAGESGLVVSVIPGLAIGKKDGGFSVDAGAGAANLSKYQFGSQDYGGPFQFALTVGAGLPVYKHFGLGYRFVHYSDAGIHGGDSIGADFHMIEFSYWF